MRTRHLLQVLLFAIGFALAHVVAVAAETSKASEKQSALPEYKLKVGRLLVYRGTSQPQDKPKEGERSTRTKTTWNLLVTGRSDDGSWRLVGRCVFSVDQGTTDKDAAPFERSSLVSFTLRPNGQLVWQGDRHFIADPNDVFPRLPASIETARKGWEFLDQATGARHQYALAPAADLAAGKWIMHETRTSPLNEIYEVTDNRDFHFDLSRGLVDHVETASTQKAYAETSYAGVMDLGAATEPDANWLALLAQDFDRYAKAAEECSRLETKAMKDPDATEKLWADGARMLKEARAKVHVPMVQEQLDKEIADHESELSYAKDAAANYAEIVKQPAVDWEVADLKGNKHSLAKYHGKIVVLDFWYRGCGWCIRAMPQIKQLAAHFDGQPVAVLGMNIDDKEEDANFVIDKLKLDYPNLKAEGIPEKYKVHGYPTLIVIDQEGKVRDVHIGYSPTLKDDLVKTIQAMLP